MAFDVFKDSESYRADYADSHERYKSAFVEPRYAFLLQDLLDAVQNSFVLLDRPLSLKHDFYPFEWLHDHDLGPA